MENNIFGLKVQGSSNTTVNNSVATGNSFAGFSTAGCPGPDDRAQHVEPQWDGGGCAAGTTVRIGGMSIMDNPTAVTGACFSLKNNDMDVAVTINPINPQ